MFFDSPEHNIKVEILPPFSCNISTMQPGGQGTNINSVNMALSTYARTIRYDGGAPIKFRFSLHEKRYISVYGDIMNFLYVLKDIGFISDSKYIEVSQQYRNLIHTNFIFSTDKVPFMEKEWSQVRAAFLAGNQVETMAHVATFLFIMANQ